MTIKSGGFALFGVHIFLGNPYEMRTVGAMTVRTVFWIFISISLMKMSSDKKNRLIL
ncbi:hypothetical protein [Halobacteriovorax marinus]|uniref:hypothetical protein n=1 Tax=Halobacteriovorax marinus TaxID=97084 RepID=UPI003A94D39D